MNAALHAPVGSDDGQTVFGVLAERARIDSSRRLLAYLIGGVTAASAIALGVPAWWPLAVLAIASSAFGAWGLLDRRAEAPTSRTRMLHFAIATTGTVAALLFIAGLFLVWFTGDTISPYGHGQRARGLTGPDTVQAPAGFFP